MNHSSPRRLIIVRHGERVDFCFNDRIHWTSKVLDSNGRYRPFNLNIPRNLPKRANGVAGFRTDTPLTEIGYLQSKLIGRALRDKSVSFDVIYVSPALRCIQTAIGILKGMNCNSLKLNIEPGLFEWLQLCRNNTLPNWMTLEELIDAGYSINLEYNPVYKISDLNTSESLDDYYQRSYKVTRNVLDRTGYNSILFVAHGSSLDACTRLIVGGQPRSNNDFYDILQKTPYLSTIQLDEYDKKCEIVGSPVPPLKHSVNNEYDHRIVNRY
uniref:Phosphoglycerate mutase n=1 Tax=Panagrolaimus sp. JU765 TaxID=591449 RepID=A0AC34Q1U8_9BILA